MRFEIQELNNQFNSIFRNSDDMTSHDDLGPPSGLDYPINTRQLEKGMMHLE